MEVRVDTPEMAAGLVGVTVGAQLFPPGMKTGQKETDRFSGEVSVGHRNHLIVTNSGGWASPATTPNTEAPRLGQSSVVFSEQWGDWLASQRTMHLCTQDQTLGTWHLKSHTLCFVLRLGGNVSNQEGTSYKRNPCQGGSIWEKFCSWLTTPESCVPFLKAGKMVTLGFCLVMCVQRGRCSRERMPPFLHWIISTPGDQSTKDLGRTSHHHPNFNFKPRAHEALVKCGWQLLVWEHPDTYWSTLLLFSAEGVALKVFATKRKAATWMTILRPVGSRQKSSEMCEEVGEPTCWGVLCKLEWSCLIAEFKARSKEGKPTYGIRRMVSKGFMVFLTPRSSPVLSWRRNDCDLRCHSEERWFWVNSKTYLLFLKYFIGS